MGGPNGQRLWLPMAITAENLAEKYNVTREECDEFVQDLRDYGKRRRTLEDS